MKKIFQTYFLPGFIFQSITVGGGYGTGRELVEFFLLRGPIPGLKGMLVASLIWSLVLAITFELARLTRSYNYRDFLRVLLGKAWWAYEIVYGLGMILVVSIVGSASGEILGEMLGTPKLVGIIFMSVCVGVLAYAGSAWIERVLSFWSIALYIFYFTLVVLCFQLYSQEISNAFLLKGGEGSWLMGGIKYAAYNVGIVPAILYVVRHLDNREEAIGSGIIAGLMTMVPGVCIYLAMLSQYPGIEEEIIPATYLMAQIGIPGLALVFEVILFGTLIETGVGIIHGYNERIASVWKEKDKLFSGGKRLMVALTILILAIFMADAIGLVKLIAQGYGMLTWGYWLVFLLPVMSYGVYLIVTIYQKKATS